jgi:AraC family cel operon transcriptional repressor
LYSEELIDPDTEIHYAFHKSLKNITAIHSHNFFELFLIVKGELLHIINNRTHKLSEGTLVFIRPNDVHFYQRSDNNECQLINLAFRQSTVKELFNYLGNGFPSNYLLKRTLPAKVVLSHSEKDILSAKLQHLNTIPRDHKNLIKTTLRILLFEIFTKYFSLQSDEDKRHLPMWLDTLLYEIQKKEYFVQGVKIIYDLSKRTPEHLSRVFRKYLNETPTGYINELRLNYAANLLSNSDENIPFISMEAGFENLSHFYHLFKKKFNTSPAEFRKKTQKISIPY